MHGQESSNLVLYGKLSDTCIVYLAARETVYYTEYPAHARTVVPTKNDLGTRLGRNMPAEIIGVVNGNLEKA